VAAAAAFPAARRHAAPSGCWSTRASAPAYDFFELRAQAGNAAMEIAQWWERFQEAGGDERRAHAARGDEGPKKKKRRRRGGKRRPDEGGSPEEVAPGADE